MQPQRNISLSSMWATGRFNHLTEFVDAAAGFGFTQVEINYSASAEGVAEVLRSKAPISSMHAPCPTGISPRGVPAVSLSLSSLDDQERREAVEFARKTVVNAHHAGARAVVLHLGAVMIDPRPERMMQYLYQQGLDNDEDFAGIREHLVRERAAAAPPYFEAARKSLLELAPHAQEHNIVLGLETRVHYHEIPTPPEVEALLDDTDGAPVRYWHDIGHAERQYCLGFVPRDEWATRFAGRTAGMHLHDVRNCYDHFAPGLGDIDWGRAARLITPDMLLVCEIGEWNAPEAVRSALPFLRKKGII